MARFVAIALGVVLLLIVGGCWAFTEYDGGQLAPEGIKTGYVRADIYTAGTKFETKTYKYKKDYWPSNIPDTCQWFYNDLFSPASGPNKVPPCTRPTATPPPTSTLTQLQIAAATATRQSDEAKAAKVLTAAAPSPSPTLKPTSTITPTATLKPSPIPTGTPAPTSTPPPTPRPYCESTYIAGDGTTIEIKIGRGIIDTTLQKLADGTLVKASCPSTGEAKPEVWEEHPVVQQASNLAKQGPSFLRIAIVAIIAIAFVLLLIFGGKDFWNGVKGVSQALPDPVEFPGLIFVVTSLILWAMGLESLIPAIGTGCLAMCVLWIGASVYNAIFKPWVKPVKDDVKQAADDYQRSRGRNP